MKRKKKTFLDSGFESLLCFLPAMWPWASHSNSKGLSFLILQKRIIIAPTLGLQQGLVHVRQRLAGVKPSVDTTYAPRLRWWWWGVGNTEAGSPSLFPAIPPISSNEPNAPLIPLSFFYIPEVLLHSRTYALIWNVLSDQCPGRTLSTLRLPPTRSPPWFPHLRSHDSPSDAVHLSRLLYRWP